MTTRTGRQAPHWGNNPVIRHRNELSRQEPVIHPPQGQKITPSSMNRLPGLLLSLLLVLHTTTALSESSFDQLPDLGDASGQVISPQQDIALGKAFMRQVRQSGLILDDQEVNSYLGSLGNKLAANSDNPGHSFTFFLVDDSSINAFAGPGGYIGVNVGLFITAESESELAGVMAHEIAHVTQRHLARRFDAANKMSLPTTAAVLAAILIGATADGSAGAAALTAASAANMQYQINFTRANEYEADRVGIQTLADAGFDPYGMPQFFEKLQKNSKLYGTRPPEFLSTHPVTTNRIAEATSRADNYPRKPAYTSLDFLLLRAKLRVRSYKDSKQVLADFQRYQGESGGSTPAEKYEFALLLAANGKYAQAETVMQKLQKADPDRITYQLALADILIGNKQRDRALAVYKDALTLYPDNLAVALPYATALMDAGREEDAYNLLSDITGNHQDSAKAYKLLAQAAGATGHKAQTHTAMSQYYFLNGFTNQAIEQLKLAEKQPELNDYNTARIQARITQLETILEAEKLE
jgi:predicted Zn-dependent protease